MDGGIVGGGDVVEVVGGGMVGGGDVVDEVGGGIVGGGMVGMVKLGNGKSGIVIGGTWAPLLPVVSAAAP
ncbi:MAG TPA: hypothetical protein VF045_00955 [Acidimicrobiales bacterium]